MTNSGTHSTIGDVTLTDNVPTGLTPTVASGAGWTCGVSGATVTCTRSDALAPGASYPLVTITVDVATIAPASVANTATISGGGDVNTANNTATDVATIMPAASQVADLAVTKTDGQTSYAPGTAISYTIMVTNAGPATAAAFSVADNVPAAITGVSVTCVVTGTGIAARTARRGTASASPRRVWRRGRQHADANGQRQRQRERERRPRQYGDRGSRRGHDGRESWQQLSH